MFSLALNLDPKGRIPMYEQLYAAVAGAIRDGALRSGEKLPSKRALCASLGVSRSTVETAYELLLAEGYVESRPRSGYYVAKYETSAVSDAPSSAPVCALGHLPPRGKALERRRRRRRPPQALFRDRQTDRQTDRQRGGRRDAA